MITRKVLAVAIVLSMGYLVLDGPPSTAQHVQNGPEVGYDLHHDVSPPLRQIVPGPRSEGPKRAIPLRIPAPLRPRRNVIDPVLQSTVTPLVAASTMENFIGVGVGLGKYSDCCAPPDTNGAAGATQFVEWVNVDFAVFSKTGTLVHGPVAGNTLWSGFGGQCEAHNDGDPIAQYDKAAGRWVLAQPVFEKPYTYCIAVSTTSDATGSYHRYAFSMPSFPDYPKLGVWSDGYYASFNMFNGNHFVGARACAFNRTAMLAGTAATQVCFQQSGGVVSLLPSDLDGATAPPSGSPDYFLNFGSNVLNLWKFHADFKTPSNSTFSGPSVISVASFSEACGGGSCIPQLGTKQQLDSLGDRVMYRLAYRNFGTHESLVVNHSVSTGTGNTGVRWYELRNTPPGAATMRYQQGTFAPDSNFRWMGSIGMDKAGDIAVGYSVSSSSIHPAISYTGRVPTDTLGTMESEATIIDGTGSQLQNLNRWGDYSGLTIDPANDCNFWYANEYLESDGTFNWSTRIASFKFSGCT